MLTYGIGFLAVLWTRRKQALHDGVSGALVVRRETDDAFFGIRPILSEAEHTMAAKEEYEAIGLSAREAFDRAPDLRWVGAVSLEPPEPA